MTSARATTGPTATTATRANDTRKRDTKRGLPAGRPLFPSLFLSLLLPEAAGVWAHRGEQTGMNLAVSTLGCPDWTLEQIASRLPGYGYAGVELRGLGPDLDVTLAPAFGTAAAASRSRRTLEAAGLVVCALDSSCTLAAPVGETRAATLDEGRRMIDLAALLGAASVRVFGGALPEGEARESGVARAAEGLLVLGDYAARNAPDVSVVLETHDAFSTGAQAADVLRQASHPNAGALWDLHHPFRQGETPQETFAAIGAYVRMTHVKDSRPGGTYCALGEGDVPVPAMLALLHQGGYRGWLSLEWEKRWIPALTDPEIAFPQYAARLNEYLAELGKNGHL